MLRQLEGRHGSLDAPPLAAAAAVTLAGAAALSSLAKYYERDVASQWGAADVIQQATQFLRDRFEVSNPLPPPPDGEHQAFDDLLAVATAIRGH